MFDEERVISGAEVKKKHRFACALAFSLAPE
jgi:hypothetical protein